MTFIKFLKVPHALGWYFIYFISQVQDRPALPPSKCKKREMHLFKKDIIPVPQRKQDMSPGVTQRQCVVMKTAGALELDQNVYTPCISCMPWESHITVLNCSFIKRR